MADELITKDDLRAVTFIIEGDRGAIKIDDAPGGGLRVFCDFQAGVQSVRVRTRPRAEGDAPAPGTDVKLSDIPLSGKDPEGFQEKINEGATREQLLHDVAPVSPTAAAELGLEPGADSSNVSPVAEGATSESLTQETPEATEPDTSAEQPTTTDAEVDVTSTKTEEA